MVNLRRTLFAVFAMALMVTGALAQPTTGTVKGTLTDDSGGVIPAATVSLAGNGVAKTAQTQADGTYTFAGLKPGDYTVTLSFPGFQPFRKLVTVAPGGRPGPHPTGGEGGTAGDHGAGRIRPDAQRGARQQRHPVGHQGRRPAGPPRRSRRPGGRAASPGRTGRRPNGAVALGDSGRFAEAALYYRRALELDPAAEPVLNNLAWLLATCPMDSVRNGPEAVTLAQRAVELSGGADAGVLDTLAAAYAEAGRFADAAATLRKALDLAWRQRKFSLVDGLEVRLGLYEAGKPYRQPPPAADSLDLPV